MLNKLNPNQSQNMGIQINFISVQTLTLNIRMSMFLTRYKPGKLKIYQILKGVWNKVNLDLAEPNPSKKDEF